MTERPIEATAGAVLVSRSPRMRRVIEPAGCSEGTAGAVSAALARSAVTTVRP